MAKSTYRSDQPIQLVLALLIGILIGAMVMAYLNKGYTTNQMEESIVTNDDVPSLEKDLQELKSTNPFQ